MSATQRLYRPVGLTEMELILASNAKVFPRRLPEQPFFYPVLNRSHAEEIGSKWNTHDPSSGFAGFVTEFDIDADYAKRHEVHTVGASHHQGLWVRAAVMKEFNQHIVGTIKMISAFFGDSYIGSIPQTPSNIRGLDANQQIVKLADVLEYSGFDFLFDVLGDPVAVQINFPYWASHDFAEYGLDFARKQAVLRAIHYAWHTNTTRAPLIGFQDL